MTEEQVVVFSLGQEEYAVSIAEVKEIIQYKGATKLPGTPDFLEGIINLRGKVIPVVDMAKQFGLPAAENADRRAIIVETQGRELAVIVDEVTEVIILQSDAIEPAPAMAMAGGDHVRGIGKTGERLLILLATDALFSSEEMTGIKVAVSG